jgi:nucleoid-associated protein YgaU
MAIKKVMDSPEYTVLVMKYLDFDKTNVRIEALSVEVKQHTVAAGETLGTIAKKELGNSQRWTEIWEANKTRIPNPHLIHVGDQLIIP